MEEKIEKVKKEKKPKSTLTKIIIGILIALIVFLLICMAPFLMFCGAVLWEMFFVHPDKPEIEQAEIPFVLEYEYKGERSTIEDAMIYEYAGDSFALDGGTTRDWNSEMKYNEEYSFFYLDPENEPDLFIYIELNPEYYMGAPDYEWGVSAPYLSYWDAEAGQYYEDEKEIPEIDAKIISWSDPQPIENTFK
ncbi:MAG: hypothetical protein Q4C06_04265 [Bacillota bacterium]|nr:hypothetical protein [Bacillota bacterium]